MKVSTLHQPWATLVALGYKTIETRSWPTKHRGPLAIHAGKKVNKEACEHPTIKGILQHHGLTPETLPTGQILAIAGLFDCVRMEPGGSKGITLLNYRISDTEYDLGHYEPGRYGWILHPVKPLKNPIHVPGKQGLWNYEGEDLKAEEARMNGL